MSMYLSCLMKRLFRLLVVFECVVGTQEELEENVGGGGGGGGACELGV